MNPAGPNGWLLFALELVVKATLLLGGAAAVALALRRASAAWRHLVWFLAICLLLLLPILALSVPRWQLPLSNARQVGSIPETVRAAFATDFARGPASEAAAASGNSRPATSHRGSDVRWPLVIFMLWLSGLVGVSLRSACALVCLRHIARFHTSAPGTHLENLLRECSVALGIRRPVKLRLTGEPLRIPITWGFRHPHVLLPIQAAHWESERVRAVLLHELAHVYRGDWVTLMIASGACALFWFHPLVWMAARALRFEAERAADDQAIAAGLRPSTYSAELLAILHFASHLNPENERNIMIAAIPMAKNPCTVERRIRALLDRGHRRGRVTRRNILLVASAGAALVLPLAALTVRAVDTSPNKDASVESAKRDRSSPEAAVHSFVDAFNRADTRIARASIFGADPAFKSEELERQLKKVRVVLALRDLRTTIDGHVAIVTIGEGSLTSSHSDRGEPHEEVQTLTGQTLKLRSDDGVWRILPGDFQGTGKGPSQPSLSGIAGMLAASEASLANARDKAQIEVCVTNLRQLALAAHMYANDHGGRLNFGETAAPFNSLKAYAGTDSVMRCPAERPGSQYMLNPQLKNAAIGTVTNPTKTVLFYEAAESGAQLDFSHNNRTSIVFVDGHVELCSREEAARLKW